MGLSSTIIKLARVFKPANAGFILAVDISGNPILRNGATNMVIITGATGTVTINCINNMFKVTQTGAITWSITNAPLAIAITIAVIRGGAFTETWPSSVIWQDKVTPAPSTVAGLTDVYSLMTTDAGVTWIAAPFAMGVS